MCGPLFKIKQLINIPMPKEGYIYSTRSGARFASSLLAYACISFVCLLHGRLLLVPLYSMSKLNNNGSRVRYLNRPASLINNLRFDVIDNLVPTSAIFSISQPKNSLTAEPFLTCNYGKGENLLPPLRFYVQERPS